MMPACSRAFLPVFWKTTEGALGCIYCACEHSCGFSGQRDAATEVILCRFSLLFLCTCVLFFTDVVPSLPSGALMQRASAASAPRGDFTVCSSKVMPERVTIALSSAPFGSVRCTTDRIMACHRALVWRQTKPLKQLASFRLLR